MDRRNFISRAAVIAAGAGAAACGAEDTANGVAAPNVNRRRTRRLRMVTTWPAGFPGLGTAAESTARMIGELSGGALEVQVHGAGEIVSAFEAFDAVSGGVADMYHAAEYYWQGRSPAFSFFCAVPMGLTALEIMAWVDHGGGQELWEELSGQFGVIAFQAGNTGHQMGGWFKREINQLSDFRGLRMRIPGLGGDVIRALGGAAVNLSGGEIYQNLQSANIDADDWVGPWNDQPFGLYREAPYYYGPSFHEPGPALAIGINRGVWDSLDTTEQAVIRAACKAANNDNLGEFTHNNALALKTLVDDHGVQLRDFSDEIWREIGRASEQAVADAANADAITRRVYDSYIQARRRSRYWHEISEAAYYRRREQVLGN
jgi:TRAP-type mannitol/chloroaromatic compound transport system substrate-binding protein